MGLFDFFRGKSGKETENTRQMDQPTADELFQHGKEIEKQDPVMAFQDFLKAAHLGKTEAMNKVGFCYFRQGCGAKFNIEESFNWFQKAAQKGDAGSMMMLSQFYMSGVVTEQNDEMAKMWLRKAAEAGDDRIASSARKRLDDYENSRMVITAMMTETVRAGGMPPKQ